ncbi:ABC transporter permease subunit [Rhodococcus sp. G-MC3]|uniref:ABC transporter permease subunit n=1 Tax=Rhodococcus sp. G-MC3 TaxID=3046209 RepID=UPI0024B8F19E|nr:ABC transporter permease subunit [Rhodococcus sp. G-MC3]MDJ0396138.1 ABC transporter permease subunit [Rhodococcus sp. G-MC3]
MATKRARRAVNASPKSWRSTIGVIPAVLLVALVVGGGLGTVALQSLGLMPLVGTPELSVDAYSALGDELWRSVALTLSIAVVSTALATVIGLTVALTALSGRRGALVAAGLTVSVPHLIGAAAMALLLADSGMLARVLGVTDGGWPQVVGGPWWIAVVLEYAWKESGFVAVVVAGTLATRVAAYDESAATLGAGRWARLRLITLPLARPALIASAAISFAYTVGSYEVARILGRPYPEPLSVMAVRLFTSIDLASRPQAAAAATIAAALTIVVATAALHFLRRSAAWK